MLLSKVYQEKLVALVVDEAHCVKKWGDEFRLQYSYLKELRSLTSVNIMALTATASDSLIEDVIRDIGMVEPDVIQVSPDKSNLCYGVKEINTFDEFMPLVNSLREKRTTFEKTLIFCQRQVDCGLLMQLFLKNLAHEIVEPIGAPFSLTQYRLVDMYCKGTEESVKNAIVKYCTVPDSVLRIIICTTAFGMGIDCAAVTRVIHWGPPNDVETYIQHTGRAGRNSELSSCIMLHGKGLRRHCDKRMLAYIQNCTMCRRAILFKDFKLYRHKGRQCNCCDICAAACECDDCSTLLNTLVI
jgi:ATP-dependent DNA helicase RecQ